MKTPALILFLLGAAACTASASAPAQLRDELAGTERAFCAQVAKVGIADAFLAYMADECFLPDSLYLSRSEYEAAVKAARAKAGAAYHPGPNPNVQLTWEPSKVDVSADGTLGYTWGRYDYVSKDKGGKVSTSTGIYFTVWKRQADGSWKFVYDGAPQLPDDPAALKTFLARGDLPADGGSR